MLLRRPSPLVVNWGEYWQCEKNDEKNHTDGTPPLLYLESGLERLPLQKKENQYPNKSARLSKCSGHGCPAPLANPEEKNAGRRTRNRATSTGGKQMGSYEDKDHQERERQKSADRPFCVAPSRSQRESEKDVWE